MLFPLFQKLMQNAEKNALRLPRQRRHDFVIKKFATSLLIIASDSVFMSLDQIPDARGTVAYLYVLKCVIDSYLDKKLAPLTRIEKIWFRWIILHASYVLENNFITQNAFTCIELNAHSLLILRAVQTLSQNKKDAGFQPWVLGSQSCEKAFRAVRSMSSTVSTMINFGMLGLLRRLHRQHIQFSLEAENEVTGIAYPRVQEHKSKDGHGKADESTFEIENLI